MKRARETKISEAHCLRICVERSDEASEAVKFRRSLTEVRSEMGEDMKMRIVSAEDHQ